MVQKNILNKNVIHNPKKGLEEIITEIDTRKKWDVKSINNTIDQLYEWKRIIIEIIQPDDNVAMLKNIKALIKFHHRTESLDDIMRLIIENVSIEGKKVFDEDEDKEILKVIKSIIIKSKFNNEFILVTTDNIDFYIEYLNHQLNVLNANRNQLLTIIATIFLPLGFIVGFFGMNFKSMGTPTEGKGILNLKHGEIIVFVFSILFIVVGILLFYIS